MFNYLYYSDTEKRAQEAEERTANLEFELAASQEKLNKIKM
jgi:hypothetical protein